MAYASHPIPKGTSIYIDGVNCYHGIFRHKPEWKWFNFLSYFESIHRHQDIIAIKYFTALLHPRIHSPEACERQHHYLAALQTLPKLRIIPAEFQLGNDHGLEAKKIKPHAEIKKYDVNIAVHLMADALEPYTHHIILVSSDSDFQPAISWIRANKRTRLTVYIPAIATEQNRRRLDHYRKKWGSPCRFLPLEDFSKHLLPETVRPISGPEIHRPPTWV